MVRAGDESEVLQGSVLLFTQDQPTGQSYVAALEEATIPVEWVRTHSELQSRLNRADLPRPALVMVLPSRQTPLLPSELANVARRLKGEVSAQPAPSLEAQLDTYCANRSFSRRQRQVLQRYLTGSNDKEIADVFNCSAATVYEHWRRMARKASGTHKSDVINDFHRFLAGRSDNDVIPSWPASPRQSGPRQP
jgi:DNA-binding CsgD family transcriptional regulator